METSTTSDAAKRSVGPRIILIALGITLLISVTFATVIVSTTAMTEEREIAAARTAADNQGWKPLGSWYLLDGKVKGQVVLGTCAEDIEGPRDRPDDLQVLLRGPISASSASKEGAQRHLIRSLPARVVQANNLGYNVSTCFVQTR